MEIFLFWLIFSIIVGVAAGARGRSGIGWFVLAMVISPLLALILLVLLPKLAGAGAAPTNKTHVKCPDCAELVLREARVCKHCGCRLTPQPIETPAELIAKAAAEPVEEPAAEPPQAGGASTGYRLGQSIARGIRGR